MDFYNVTTLVIAVVAIVSPLATTYLNNRHQMALKQIELDEKRREDYDLHVRKVFEDYAQAVGSVTEIKSGASLQNYGSCYQLALFYADASLHEDMIELNKHILAHDWNLARMQADNVVIMLRHATEALLTAPSTEQSHTAHTQPLPSESE